MASTRANSGAARGMGSDLRRSKKQSALSSATPTAIWEAASEDAREHDRGNQQVDVGLVSRLDRAAEHVAEDQHPDYAVRERHHDQLGRSAELGDGAPMIVSVLRASPRSRASSSFHTSIPTARAPLGAFAIVRLPVRLRRISSRVGAAERQLRDRTCSLSRTRTASARRCVPCVTPTVTRRRCGLVWTSPACRGRRRRPGRGPRSRRGRRGP